METFTGPKMSRREMEELDAAELLELVCTTWTAESASIEDELSTEELEIAEESACTWDELESEDVSTNAEELDSCNESFFFSSLEELNIETESAWITEEELSIANERATLLEETSTTELDDNIAELEERTTTSLEEDCKLEEETFSSEELETTELEDKSVSLEERETLLEEDSAALTSASNSAKRSRTWANEVATAKTQSKAIFRNISLI